MKSTIIFILVLSIVYLKGNRLLKSSGCTDDAQLCPDGSSVARDPDNNCEFEECPPCPSNECVNPSTNKCESIVKCLDDPCVTNTECISKGQQCVPNYCGGCNAECVDVAGPKPGDSCTGCPHPRCACIQCPNSKDSFGCCGECEYTFDTNNNLKCSAVISTAEDICPPPVAGDSCGKQGIDCDALKAPSFTCADDICYGNCGGCTYQEDTDGNLQCSPEIIAKEDVCPCAGLENCDSYSPDGCNICKCPKDGSSSACTLALCPPDKQTDPECRACADGYTLTDGVCIEDDIIDCSAISCIKPICESDEEPVIPDGQCCPICRRSDGYCPKPLGFGICVERCFPDSCGNGQLCCSNGCGHVCIDAVKCLGKNECINNREQCDTLSQCKVDPCSINNGGCGMGEVCTADYCGGCNAICTNIAGTTAIPTTTSESEEICCDPSELEIPFACFEGCACCPDGTWSGSIGDGKTFTCGGKQCIGAENCGGTICEPDCAAVTCLKPICELGEVIVTPEGECCPVCQKAGIDCSRIKCFVPQCDPGQALVTPEDSCCPQCQDEPACNLIDCADGDNCYETSQGPICCDPDVCVSGKCGGNGLQECSIGTECVANPSCPKDLTDCPGVCIDTGIDTQPSIGCGIDNCNSYFDGCNFCSCGDNGLAACTKKFCPDDVLQEAYCTGCDDGYTLNPLTNICQPILTCANILCVQGTSCYQTSTGPACCDPDICQSGLCGGIGGLKCEDGYECVDDPINPCDPTTTSDCAGVCVDIDAEENEDKVKCSMNNRDKCDTKNGYKCRNDPECGIASGSNAECAKNKVCLKTDGRCTADADCEDEYECLGIRNGNGFCVDYQ